MQTLTLAELALFLGVVGGTVTFLAAAARALGGKPRQLQAPDYPRPRIEVPGIRPEEDAERLVDALCRGSNAVYGVSITAGDVFCTTRLQIDMSSGSQTPARRASTYRVQVGDGVTYAHDVDEVYAVVRDRLRAIAAERRERVDA